MWYKPQALLFKRIQSCNIDYWSAAAAKTNPCVLQWLNGFGRKTDEWFFLVSWLMWPKVIYIALGQDWTQQSSMVSVSKRIQKMNMGFKTNPNDLEPFKTSYLSSLWLGNMWHICPKLYVLWCESSQLGGMPATFVCSCSLLKQWMNEACLMPQVVEKTIYCSFFLCF